MESMNWIAVCPLDDIVPESGVCALIAEQQMAIFRLANDELYALSNYDPFSGAQVLSRGIVGDKNNVPKVTSPVYKQAFDLRNGQCLDDASVTLPTFPVRNNAGRVEVGLPLAASVAT